MNAQSMRLLPWKLKDVWSYFIHLLPQSEVEPEAEKDDAPASPVSPSGTP